MKIVRAFLLRNSTFETCNWPTKLRLPSIFSGVMIVITAENIITPAKGNFVWRLKKIA